MGYKVPHVSILVPVYNVEKYLGECLDSLVNQTLKNIEIICINDGSTDGSLEILKEYSNKDTRVKIIDKKNTGYGNTMNLGIEKASGEYIGIVESDDFAELDMFEVLYKEAKKNDLDVARCNFYYYKTVDGSNVKSKFSWVVHDKVYAPSDDWGPFYQQPSVWANIYKTSFIKKNKISFLETPGASYQDTAFSFKVYALANRFKIIETPLIHYRTDNDASSSVQSTSKVYCVCDEYAEIKRFIKDRGLYEKYRQLVPHLQYHGYMWNYRRLAEPYNGEFMQVWREEFTKEYEERNISDTRFTKREYENVMNILSNGKLTSISVIVPVYNMENYLRKCLDSLINQTLRDIEIICVDDGSIDRSPEILQEYQSKDSRIKVITKKNGGLSSARNAGIAATHTEYIGFVDSDDWVEPETFEVALRDIAEVDVVIFGTNVVGDNIGRRDSEIEYLRINYSGKTELTDHIRSNTSVFAWNKLYRKSIIEKYDLKFPEGKLYEDCPFYWSYIFVSKSAFFEGKKMYNYLKREGSIMSQTFAGTPKAVDHLHSIQSIYCFMNKNNVYEEHRDAFDSIFVNNFWCAYNYSDLRTKKKVLKKSTQMVKKMNLSGDSLFHFLKYKQYEKIDSSRVCLRILILQAGLKILKKLAGDDLTALSSMFPEPISSRPSPSDYTKKVATTQWVWDHEHASGMDRWWVVYAERSTSEANNWGHINGIDGGKNVRIKDLDQKIKLWNTYRALVTLDGEKSAYVSGRVFNKWRSVWGTTIYDGTEAYCISVDIKPQESTINVRAYGLKSKKDVSSRCRLLRIERTG
jgi:Glycosyltransferases involved in cell wall biogenesis